MPMMMTNATAGTVAMQLGWTGPNLCISTACASVGSRRVSLVFTESRAALPNVFKK